MYACIIFLVGVTCPVHLNLLDSVTFSWKAPIMKLVIVIIYSFLFLKHKHPFLKKKLDLCSAVKARDQASRPYLQTNILLTILEDGRTHTEISPSFETSAFLGKLLINF